MSAIVDRLYSSTNGETYSFCQLFEVVNEKNKKLDYRNVLSASQELGMIERSDINIDIKFEQEVSVDIRLSVKVIMLYIFVLFKEVLLSLIEQEYVVRRIQSYVQTI